MARFRSSRSHDDQQVDPFNAGEPILPWDDPEALHDDGCDLSESGAYAAEEKPQDDYRASEQTKPRHRYEATQTGEAVKSTQHGRRKGLRSCILVIVAIAAITQAFSGMSSCVASIFLDELDTDSSDDYSYDSSSSDEQVAEDEQAATDAVTSRLDELANDPSAIDLAKRGLDDKLKSYVGYSAEQLGIDSQAYADWFFSNVSYQVESAYVYDDTGSVTLTIGSPLTYRIASDFYDRASDYLLENELFGSFANGTDVAPPTEDQQNHLRAYFADTLANVEIQSDGYMNVSVSKQADGTWTLDEQDYQSEIDYLLGAQ